MTALQAALPPLAELRQALGQHGELSGQEAETRRLLREFLARHTSLEVYDLSGGLVAAHREPQGPCIAFRGDMDAIPGPNGPYHGCGHDGHSALLAGLGLLLERPAAGQKRIAAVPTCRGDRPRGRPYGPGPSGQRAGAGHRRVP